MAKATFLTTGKGVKSTLYVRKPRLGFVGLGWIGCHRMEAILKSEMADVAVVFDPDQDAVQRACERIPGVFCARSYQELLAMDLDGVVIATPSAMHSSQAEEALERGMAVFCQKPLARTYAETAQVVDAAREANRLLGVDFSYRHVVGMQRIRELIEGGEIGQVYAVDLVFHNAYGPDKSWFYDLQRSGGGCVIDLGIHLVDLALWTLDWPVVEQVRSRLYSKGKMLSPASDAVEDFALIELDLAGGVAVRLACSWHLPAGCDAVIEANFYGTAGGLSFRNADGSFYDFVAERFRGTSRETLVSPPDDWGGRAAVSWVRQLGASSAFDPSVVQAIQVANVVDQVYGRGPG